MPLTTDHYKPGGLGYDRQRLVDYFGTVCASTGFTGRQPLPV